MPFKDHLCKETGHTGAKPVVSNSNSAAQSIINILEPVLKVDQYRANLKPKGPKRETNQETQTWRLRICRFDLLGMTRTRQLAVSVSSRVDWHHSNGRPKHCNAPEVHSLPLPTKHLIAGKGWDLLRWLRPPYNTLNFKYRGNRKLLTCGFCFQPPPFRFASPTWMFKLPK